MSTLACAAALAVAVCLVRLYFHPFRPCPKCKRREIPGTNAGSTRRAFGDCKRCGGTRKVQRIGSRAVHRAVRGAIASIRATKGK